MDWVIGVVATVIAIIGLLVTLGQVAYLAMLDNAAKKRGLAGNRTADLVRSRWAVAGGATAAAVIGLLLTTGDSTALDLVGLLVAGGAGIAARQGLESTRKQLRDGS